MSGDLELIGRGAPCGTRARYVAGCRCEGCRGANAARHRERTARAREAAAQLEPTGEPIPSTMQRAGRTVHILRCPGVGGAPCVSDPPRWLRGGARFCAACVERATVWDGEVPAERALEHLRALSAAGVGYKAVAEACDVAPSTLGKILSGEAQRIRASTERAILEVDADARADHALVSARRVRELVRAMRRRGFTRQQIAAELGYETRALQLGKAATVTARNQARVERLWRRIQAGEVEPRPAIVQAAAERAWLLEMMDRGVPASWLSERLGFVVQRQDASRRMRGEHRDKVRELRDEVEAMTVHERLRAWPRYRSVSPSPGATVR